MRAAPTVGRGPLTMPVRIPCPACKGPCLVADQYLGTPVHCPHCRQPFVATPAEPPAAPPRLEVGDATSVGRVRKRNEDSFLVQHLAWSAADGASGNRPAGAGGRHGRLRGGAPGQPAHDPDGRRHAGPDPDGGADRTVQGVVAGGAGGKHRLRPSGSQPRRPPQGPDRPGVQGHGGDGGGGADLGRPGADRPRRRLPGLPPARRPADAAERRTRRWWRGWSSWGR